MPVPSTGTTSSKAITSLALGVVAAVFAVCCWPVGVIAAIVGAVFGFLGLKETGADPTKGGRGMAIAGLVLAGVAILISLVFVLLGIAILSDPTNFSDFGDAAARLG